MNRFFACLTLCGALACLAFAFPQTESATCRLKISVEGVQGREGLLNAILYDKSDGFPNKPEKGLKAFSVQVKESLRAGRIVLEADGLPPGEYAVSVLHDENANGEMDFNFFNMPKEGYGFSNDPKTTFGPPKYEAAKFAVSGRERTVRITMKY